MNLSIIFLDVDGVLVTRRSCIATGHGLLMTKPDPCGAELIKELCIKNCAKIVVSSTWRYNPKSLFEMLDSVGINKDFLFKCDKHSEEDACWRTRLSDRKAIRGDEIHDWLVAHTEGNGLETIEDRFVIFDDDSDFLEYQKPFHMHTTFDNGILTSHFRAAAEILKG